MQGAPAVSLRFVVERALEGRNGEIKEFVIGVEALGRNTSFDPKSDPIVRVEAGRLRERLRSYYEGEGEADSVFDLSAEGRVPARILGAAVAHPIAAGAAADTRYKNPLRQAVRRQAECHGYANWSHGPSLRERAVRILPSQRP
jgi:hypothetical protein